MPRFIGTITPDTDSFFHTVTHIGGEHYEVYTAEVPGAQANFTGEAGNFGLSFDDGSTIYQSIADNSIYIDEANITGATPGAFNLLSGLPESGQIMARPPIFPSNLTSRGPQMRGRTLPTSNNRFNYNFYDDENEYDDVIYPNRGNILADSDSETDYEPVGSPSEISDDLSDISNDLSSSDSSSDIASEASSDIASEASSDIASEASSDIASEASSDFGQEIFDQLSDVSDDFVPDLGPLSDLLDSISNTSSVGGEASELGVAEIIEELAPLALL